MMKCTLCSTPELIVVCRKYLIHVCLDMQLVMWWNVNNLDYIVPSIRGFHNSGPNKFLTDACLGEEGLKMTMRLGCIILSSQFQQDVVVIDALRRKTWRFYGLIGHTRIRKILVTRRKVVVVYQLGSTTIINLLNRRTWKFHTAQVHLEYDKVSIKIKKGRTLMFSAFPEPPRRDTHVTPLVSLDLQAPQFARSVVYCSFKGTIGPALPPHIMQMFSLKPIDPWARWKHNYTGPGSG